MAGLTGWKSGSEEGEKSAPREVRASDFLQANCREFAVRK
jgi:hypothetical protein